MDQAHLSFQPVGKLDLQLPLPSAVISSFNGSAEPASSLLSWTGVHFF
jgi:hypothetical protein